MTNIEEAVKRVEDWHNAREQYDLPDMVEMFNSEPFEGADLVSLRASDLRTLLAGIGAAKAEIAERNDQIKVYIADNERLRDALSTVHNDLLENDDPHGTVALSQSAWTLMIEALKGGA